MQKFILFKRQSWQIILFASLCTFLLSCASPPIDVGNTTSLAGLQAMAKSVKKTKRSKKLAKIKIRDNGLKETALSLGAQAGLAWRAKAIDNQLAKQERILDNIYDFNALILDHNILPPVLLEGRNSLNLADPQTIRVADRIYKLVRQARFITTPPTWRQYLWMDYKQPERPHVSLLPKTQPERDLWCFYVERGWSNGIDQANIIFEENVARIKEDFTGMLLYRKLLAMNMVSPPYVAHTELGITGDESEMHIDDQVLRITALPALNIDSSQWRAALTKEKNILAKFRQMEKLALNNEIVVTSKAWQPIISPTN